MKILVNTGLFNGGAPLSILEYAKIAKKNGHEIVAVGEYATTQNRYIENGIRTYNIPYFTTKRIWKNLVSLSALNRIIKQEKPDLIHATSYGIVPSKFISKIHGLPILYSIAGGREVPVNVFDNENIIVYSFENKEDLIISGYKEDRIEVISNRLSTTSSRIIDCSIYNKPQDEIKLLMISRLDTGLINSVINIMDVTSKISEKCTKIKLDIVGSGELINIVLDRANQINKKTNKNIISVHGYVDNTYNYIEKSHIVFGKGRSIIEAILNNRISFVIGEDHSIALCNPQTIENLYKYNFSGRNINKNISLEELLNVIYDVKIGKVDQSIISETNRIVDKLYNIKHVEDRIINIYENKIKSIACKKERSKAFAFLFEFYKSEICNIQKWKRKVEKTIKKSLSSKIRNEYIINKSNPSR